MARVLSVAATLGTAVAVSFPATNVAFSGRTRVGGDGRVEFDSSASSFSFEVLGATSAVASMSQKSSDYWQPNFFHVFVDGVLQVRIKTKWSQIRVTSCCLADTTSRCA